MRKQTVSKVVFSLVLSAGLLAGGFALAPSLAGESGSAPAAERQWLSIGQVHQKLEAAGFRNVEKIEREHGTYEVRATDRQGARVRLDVHPQTGAILERGARRQAQDGTDSRQRPSAICNERRCRDDIPPKAATP